MPCLSVLAEGAGMRKQRCATVATIALIGCAVCHIWMVIQLIRSYADELTAPSLPFMVLYMLSVCMFNWFALNSDSAAYQKVARTFPALHIVLAAFQGVLLQTSDGKMGMGGLVLAMANLPLNSAAALKRPESLIPWGICLFFAS